MINIKFMSSMIIICFMIWQVNSCEIKSIDNIDKKIIRVTHPDNPGKHIHLLPTVHWDSQVSDEKVDYINNNCNKFYFESGESDNLEFFTEVDSRKSTRENMVFSSCSIPTSEAFKNGSACFSRVIQQMNNKPNLEKIIAELNEENIALSDTSKDIIEYANARSTNFDNEIADLKNQMNSKDLIAVEDFLNAFYKDEKFINPYDLITISTYVLCMQSAANSYKSIQNLVNELGDEDSLTEKLQKKRPGVIFFHLEDTSSILRGLRKLVIAHTDIEDPYKKWIDAFSQFKKLSLEQLDNLFSNLEDKLESLPSFFKQTIRRSMFLEREAGWLPKMEDDFMKSKDGKGSLFAIGKAHIKSISEQLKKKGYIIEDQ